MEKPKPSPRQKKIATMARGMAKDAGREWKTVPQEERKELRQRARDELKARAAKRKQAAAEG